MPEVGAMVERYIKLACMAYLEYGGLHAEIVALDPPDDDGVPGRRMYQSDHALVAPFLAAMKGEQ